MVDPGIFDNRGPGLQDYWLTIRKHVGVVIAALFVSIFVTAIVVFTTTPIFTAQATILIEPNEPQVLDIKQVLSDSFEQDNDDYFKTQYELLKSRTLAAEVVRQENLASDPIFTARSGSSAATKGLVSGWLVSIRKYFTTSSMTTVPKKTDGSALGVPSGLVSRYLAGLQVKPEPGTRLVRLLFSSPNPELSARLANAHATAFIHRGLELRSGANEEAQQFLQDKLVELKERVERSEAALNAYRRDKGILALSSEKDLVVQRLDQLSHDLMSAESNRINLESQEKLILKGEFESLPSVTNSNLILQLKASLSQLEGEYANLSARYNPGYPRLDQLHAQIEETRRHLDSEIRTATQSSHSAYNAAVVAEKTLRDQFEKQKTAAFSEKDSGVQAAILAREVDTNKQLYDSILQRMKETGVAAQVKESNVYIVDHAEPPHAPSRPRRSLDFLVSAVIGLGFGLGLPFLIESLDDTLSNPEKVEHYLRLPNLTLVPHFAQMNGVGYVPAVQAVFSRKPRRKKRGEVAKPSDVRHNDLVVGEGRGSVMAEAYRTLRSAMLLSRAGEPPRITLITSAINSEGKTVTAVNLAASFAQMGLRVLIVDADLRRPRCHRIFNLRNDHGLTEVLTGMGEAVREIVPTGVCQLDILKAGSQPPNPAELLSSLKMRQTIKDLRGTYDFIVIDSAPIMLVSDGLSLSTIVDGTLLVVNSQTAKNLVRMTCSRLNFVGAKILGVALNKVNIKGPEYYYKDYYYSYRNHSYYESNDEAEKPVVVDEIQA